MSDDGTEGEILRYADGLDAPDEVSRIALVLMRAWGQADPRSTVSRYPASYVATFADMARAVIADRASGTEPPTDADRRRARDAALGQANTRYVEYPDQNTRVETHMNGWDDGFGVALRRPRPLDRSDEPLPSVDALARPRASDSPHNAWRFGYRMGFNDATNGVPWRKYEANPYPDAAIEGRAS